MDLGKALKKARGRHFTQGEIAGLTGVTNIYVSLVECNKRKPCLSWLEKFSLAVNIPVPFLFFMAMDGEDAMIGMESEYKVVKPVIDSYFEMMTGIRLDG